MYVMVQKDTSVDIDVPLDEQMFRDVKKKAEEEGISVDEWIIRAVVEKMKRESERCGRDKHAGNLTDDTYPEYKAKD